MEMIHITLSLDLATKKRYVHSSDHQDYAGSIGSGRTYVYVPVNVYVHVDVDVYVGL